MDLLPETPVDPFSARLPGRDGAPAVLGDVLAHHAHRRPQAPALQMAGRGFDYGKLARRTERAAARLWHGWGVRPGDRVAYLGLNHPDQITLLFALAHIGAMLVPLNFRLAEAEWQALLADCSPRCLLHDASWADAAATLGRGAAVPVHPLEALIATHAPGEPPCHAAPQQPALLVYTSGTTGLPKGAVHTQANLLANMVAAAEAQAMTADDVVLTVLPMFHVGGLCIQTLPALFAGASVILHDRFDAAATLQAIARHRPTLTLQVPATMRALSSQADWARADLTCLRAVWAGSSLLPDDLVQAFLARGVPLCNVYGATETGPFSIALGPAQAASHAGSCGWPARDVQVRLAGPRPDDAGPAGDVDDVPDGEVGELWLRAPNVVRHYWPDQPAVDAGGWFHSGDLARRAPDGSYTVVGRLKDLIISGGENIYPAEIERALALHPAVADCAVLGLPDKRWGEVLVAAVVFRHQNGSDPASEGDLLLSNWEDELTRFLAQRVARFKLPRRWVRLDALPRTALGKVQKAVLTQWIAGAGDAATTAPP
ncbi:MAG: AMP-binding protein [Burkholderiaceae bacterium]|nr:AMP-binding protein [Burkholderiaceae bacterium]